MVEHQIRLQGFNFFPQNSLQTKTPPTVLSRIDQEFIPAILSELKTPEGRELLKGTVNKKADADNIARFFQPVHRTFHVALFELFCEEPGFPRLDPKKIAGSGLVIRRKAKKSETVVIEKNGKKTTEISEKTVLQGWLQSGDKIQGWMDLTQAQQLQDPDPVFRPAKLRSGHSVVDKEFQQKFTPADEVVPFSETFSPLFVAPPEVCQAAKKTILYGLIPLTSNEVSEAKEEPPTYGSSSFSASDPIYRHMSKLLTQTLENREYNWNNKTITRELYDVSKTSGSDNVKNDWSALIAGLEQLLIEFDAFGDSILSTEMFNTLNLIQLPYKKNNGELYYKSAGNILKQATDLLVHRDESITKLEMPIHWPKIDNTTQEKIWKQVLANLTERAKQINPGVGRYDELEQQYQLEAFVRVTHDEVCPPKLLWSGPSQVFTIAAWYESGDVPPVRISLPDVTDKNFLKKLKPSVAFAMPESLFNSMKGMKLDDLIDGKKPKQEQGGIGLGWICGFNIPIITFCAFIVLSIFLSLLNFIFQWLMFIKICIPFPVKK